MEILAIGAHADDIEIGCGGSIARLNYEGNNITGIVLTKSEWTNENNQKFRNYKTVKKENEKASKILGYNYYCLEQKAMNLSYSDELVIEILKIIKGKKIDMLFMHYCNDANYDHRAAAQICLTISKKVPKVLVYNVNWYPSFSEYLPNLFINITNTWEKKIESLKCYKSEFARQGKRWTEYLKSNYIINGMKINKDLAEGFICLRYSL